MNQFLKLEQLVNTTSQTDLTILLQDEKNKIISHWQQSLYGADDKTAQHIRFYQYKLLGLMETVSAQLPPETVISPQPDHPLMQVYDTLQELLGCLEEKYFSSFDFHCPVPYIHLLAARQELEREIPLLKQVLSGTGMMEIVLAPFENILQLERISFQQLYYIRELTGCLQELQPDSTSGQVEEILLYMNFNDRHYLKYKLKLLSENISSFPTVHQQLTQSKWLLKNIHQQQEQYDFYYNPELPSLKQQICEWLTHEKDYLEHKIMYPEDKVLPQEMAKWHNFKVKTDLSVNELAFLLRVMLEHGLIMNKSKSEVADFFASYFATNNQMAISPDSLRRKMYDYSVSNAEAVKQLLLDLFHTSKRINAE